ncbi:MAG: hypothetical protein Q8M66_02170 [Actinomycetota bacterium]|nr:hypothetical protein [Actinomycetota bacterium]MDZ4180446.1 hypothetical protein [Coriobacteriia bacterium]
MNSYDPTGAVMDSDGNGRADNYDHNLQMAKTTKNPVLKELYTARANSQYQGAHGSAAQVRQAEERRRAAEERAATIRADALAQREAQEVADRQQWADWAQGVQTTLAVAGAGLAVAAVLGTPVGWGLVCAVAVGYLAAGYARASLGDSDYSWKRYGVDATVTVVTLGVGGGSAAAAAQAGFAGVSRAATGAWGMYQGTMLVME